MIAPETTHFNDKITPMQGTKNIILDLQPKYTELSESDNFFRLLFQQSKQAKAKVSTSFDHVHATFSSPSVNLH